MDDDSARFLDYFRSLITVPFVADPTEWPKADSAKCCLFEAVNIAGQCINGELWTGRELHAGDWPMQPNARAAMGSRRATETGAKPPKFNLKYRPDPRFGGNPRPSLTIEQEQKLWEENVGAVKRLKGASEWLAQQCRDGAVKSYVRMVGGGKLDKMQPSEWFVEDAFAKFFARGGYHREFAAYSEPVAAYIFVERRDLEDAFLSPQTEKNKNEALRRRDIFNLIQSQGLQAKIDEEDIQKNAEPFTEAEIRRWIDCTTLTDGKKARNLFMKERRAKGLSGTFEQVWREIHKHRGQGRPVRSA